jgi:hypothetical protein
VGGSVEYDASGGVGVLDGVRAGDDSGVGVEWVVGAVVGDVESAVGVEGASGVVVVFLVDVSECGAILVPRPCDG